MIMRNRRASVQCVPLALVLLSLATSSVQAARLTTSSVRVRHLVCRGKSGIDLRMERDPSPRDARSVAMVLRYERSAKVPGADFTNLDPGTCSWNPALSADVPPEPGVVQFDVWREAQPWSAPGTRLLDTTATAAEHFPDVISLPRYLNDPSHYWAFYVDDATNFSWSFGAFVTNKGPPKYFEVTGSQTSDATRVTRPVELRCRGGTGLSFQRGGSAGTNLVFMTLAYGISPNAAGELGRGLAQGTCAWADRTGMRTEPGQIRFTTSGNAQLKQAQSGGVVDRSPNAAERFPDANTIPVYLQDAAHYWTFTVLASRPDSATAHSVWKPSVTTTIAGPVSKESPTRSIPSSPGSGVRSPGNAEAGVATAARAPLRVDGVGMVLDRFTIQFSGRPNASPTVLYSVEQPVQEKTGHWRFPNDGSRAQVAGGSTETFRASYTAWSPSAPERGKLYNYIITVPATAGAKEEQFKGQLTTLAQHVRVAITSIELLYTRKAKLDFRLYVFSNGKTAWGDIGGPSEWKLGTHMLSGEAVVENAPDQIMVSVFGDGAGWFRVSSNPARMARSMGAENADYNAARRDFTIGISPTERYVVIPFVIRSIDGNYLMFEAHGQIQVTRK
jgi:hypothetical protein